MPESIENILVIYLVQLKLFPSLLRVRSALRSEKPRKGVCLLNSGVTQDSVFGHWPFYGSSPPLSRFYLLNTVYAGDTQVYKFSPDLIPEVRI